MLESIDLARRHELADMLAAFRTGDWRAVGEAGDLEHARQILARFGSVEVGPGSFCAACVCRRQQAELEAELARGPVLECTSCGHRERSVPLLHRHTTDAHGRPPTDRERTPKGRAA